VRGGSACRRDLIQADVALWQATTGNSVERPDDGSVVVDVVRSIKHQTTVGRRMLVRPRRPRHSLEALYWLIPAALAHDSTHRNTRMIYDVDQCVSLVNRCWHFVLLSTSHVATMSTYKQLLSISLFIFLFVCLSTLKSNLLNNKGLDASYKLLKHSIGTYKTNKHYIHTLLISSSISIY